MEKKHPMYMIIPVFIFIATVLLSISYHEFSYFLVPVLIIGFLNVFMDQRSQKELENYQKLGERLFLQNFGMEADKTELIQRPVSTYDRLQHGIFGKGVQMKFRSQGKVYKGIVDSETETLHMKEPLFLPVYTDGSISIWKETPQKYGSGMPKKVEYYDCDELLQRIEYLDENGQLKKGSWRRYEGREEYWNPKKEEWEPIP